MTTAMPMRMPRPDSQSEPLVSDRRTGTLRYGRADAGGRGAAPVAGCKPLPRAPVGLLTAGAMPLPRAAGLLTAGAMPLPRTPGRKPLPRVGTDARNPDPPAAGRRTPGREMPPSGRREGMDAMGSLAEFITISAIAERLQNSGGS
jgi:hypothetical protein